MYEYRREPLEREEIEKLKQHCKDFKEKLIVNVLFETGMRVAEFCNLKYENISWQRDCINIIGKGSKRRVIPMSRLAREYLEKYFVTNDRIEFNVRTVQRQIKIIAERAGITKKVTPHVMRHSFAVEYLHKGGNSRALQSILGHSSLVTTDCYLNYSGERVIEDFGKEVTTYQ